MLPEVGWACQHRLPCYRTIVKDRDELKVEVAVLKEKIKMLQALKRQLKKKLSDGDEG